MCSRSQMKSAPLGLAGCQEWRLKFNHGSTSSGWRRLLAVETLAINPCMIAPPAKIYARDQSRSRWNMKHFRQTARAVAWSHSAAHCMHCIWLGRENKGQCANAWTGHDRSQCTTTKARTGRERGPPWRPSEASYLTVWALNDRFFASPVFCMLRRVLSEYWRKETEKWKIFWWDGRFGRSLLCPGRAEKETRGSWPTTGCLPVDRNKLGPDSWRDKKGVWYRTDRQTDRQTDRHTHTELKRRGPPGPRR